MNTNEDMREEYGDVLKDGARGKYYDQGKRGVRAVLLDSDVAEVFTSGEQINQILRALIPTLRRRAS